MPASETTHRVDVKCQTPSAWSSSSATSTYRHVRFDPDHWPHFSGNFIRYEHMVLAARDQLFETHGRGFNRARQHQLLLDGLLTPTNSIRRDAAAVAGWAVSWLGPSQALAPPTDFTAPALGLTGWLAHLPLRIPYISGRAWHEQVTQWLAEYLAHSACMWAEVAEFMSTRGHYLLYGEAVHPISLALRHRTVLN